MKLYRQLYVDKAIMTYHFLNRAVPRYLCFRFVQRSDTLSYQLRGSDHRLAIPLPRTNYCKRSLTNSGAVLCNGLPLGLTQSSFLDFFPGWGVGGGGGYSQKNWVGVCGSLPKTLSLFQTKICEFPYPISDLTKNLIPYFRPDP